MHRAVRTTLLALALLPGLAGTLGAALALRAPSVAGASAIQDALEDPLGGPFEGTFEGTAYGSQGTSAPLALALTQRGTEVNGTATLGEGLYVTSARCGGAPVPAGTVQGSGQTAAENLRQVRLQTEIQVQGFTVPVFLSAELSPDGQTLTGALALDVPALCGPDLSLPGTLQRTAVAGAPVA
jgi:hypothetical protein